MSITLIKRNIKKVVNFIRLTRHNKIETYDKIDLKSTIENCNFPYVPYVGGFVKSRKQPYDKVVIGNDIWIGAHRVILPGVKIGDGAIIGAGSIVTRDVESYSIVAGNPAKLLRWRFDNQIISELKEMKWWFWEDNKIKYNINFFTSPLTIKSIQELKANNCTDHL